MSDSEEEEQVSVLIVVPSAPGPSTPLTESYTYHSPKPTAPGPYMLGVDEAGRGPVLGPLVYGVAYCPVAYKDQLEELGFADSKTLTHEIRSSLLETLSSDPSNLAWSVEVLWYASPLSLTSLEHLLTNHFLSSSSYLFPSQDATIHLIRTVIASGIHLSEVYVDALGSTDKYQSYLSSLFPGIEFTVTQKADSKFKIVGAASVAAKVTRDACIEGWYFEEDKPTTEGEPVESKWSKGLGSGYPSDPNTVRWLKGAVDPVFGFPKLVRFSWTTVKVLLDKEARGVKWTDEGQATLVKAFESGSGLDKDRSAVTRDLHLSSVSVL
ncbi:hypothetical protein EST38_g318 [Candolleomyces aberdarensis]|uniref:Ribonuclease n=1 Tax=Candolleomyces aberdarensis TaxID=2316362 RepID=A0A4Q2DYY8_9AGAR|nr:hypothetical protein EST38_g318 [Candolleomyces aberdarensis]